MFHELLVREGVTVLNQTPSAFRQLIHADRLPDRRHRAGPALRDLRRRGPGLQMLRPWFDGTATGSPQLVNMYGITETTVHVTYRPIGDADLDAMPAV